MQIVCVKNKFKLKEMKLKENVYSNMDLSEQSDPRGFFYRQIYEMQDQF